MADAPAHDPFRGLPQGEACTRWPRSRHRGHQGSHLERPAASEPGPDQAFSGSVDQEQAALEQRAEPTQGICRIAPLGDQAKMVAAEVVCDFLGIDQFAK
jgi:hypothetical protein